MARVVSRPVPRVAGAVVLRAGTGPPIYRHIWVISHVLFFVGKPARVERNAYKSRWYILHGAGRRGSRAGCMVMVVAGKTKRTLVRRAEPEPSFQPRVDQYLVGLTSPFRITILKFLARARAFGEPLQPFTSIQKAIETIDHFISTANLAYHLTELKNVNLVDHVEDGVDTPGYRINERGNKILRVYYELEGMDDQVQILHPNVLLGYVYEHHVDRLLHTTVPSAHVIAVTLQPRNPRDPPVPGTRGARGPGDRKGGPGTGRGGTGKPGTGSTGQARLDRFA